MYISKHITILCAIGSLAFAALNPRQNRSSIIMTGVVNGDVGYRREIYELRKDEDAWNIYPLGRSRFQSIDGREPMSFYQLSAIHGQPCVTWYNNEPCSDCTMVGYRSHQSILFPTWHRAYLAPFEQSLVDSAMAVAEQFTGPDHDRYLRAAQTLRMSYWYWAELPAEGENPFPQAFTDEEVFVNSPDGSLNITNPLKEYKFKATEGHDFISDDVTMRRLNFTLNNRRRLRSDLWTALSFH